MALKLPSTYCSAVSPWQCQLLKSPVFLYALYFLNTIFVARSGQLWLHMEKGQVIDTCCSECFFLMWHRRTETGGVVGQGEFPAEQVRVAGFLSAAVFLSADGFTEVTAPALLACHKACPKTVIHL